MLRRKPTAITLTSEDLSTYEDRQARKALLRAEAERQQALAQAQAQAQAVKSRAGIVTPQSKAQQNKDPNEELRPLSVEKGKKTREERLGIAGRS